MQLDVVRGEKVSKHFRKTLPDIFAENIDKVYSSCKEHKPIRRLRKF